MPTNARRLTFAMLAAASALALGTLATPAHAQSKMKQCADQWNEMKAKNQTNGLTYRDFSKQCMSGSADAPAAAPAANSNAKPTATTTAAPKPTAASAREEEESGTSKDDLTKCNAGWKDYKAKNNVSGAKAWHVFMARCLP